MLEPSPWVTVFVLVGAVALSGAGTVWGMRALIRGGAALSIHLIAIGVWTFTYGVSLGTSVSDAIAIRNVAQVFVILGPASLLAFAARFTGRDAWFERWGRPLLVGLFLFFSTMALTNYRGWYLPHGRNSVTARINEPGPVFILGTIVITIIVATASVWFLQYGRAAYALRKREALVLTGGIGIAWVGSVLTPLHVFPFGIDATSLGFIAHAIALAFIVLTDRSAELRRIWEIEIVRGYGDGFLFVTPEGRIMHGNEACQAILGRHVSELAGHPVSDVLGGTRDLEEMLRAGQGSHTDTVMIDGTPRELLLEAYRVRDRASRVLGIALHLRDVSAQYLDTLTGVGNRRHFLEHAERALLARPKAGAWVALLDLDHLKEINDIGGHAAGDAALARLGQVLKALAPGGATCGRIGGDEFAILLPGDDVDSARAFVDLVRNGLATADPTWTVSAGLAAVHPEEPVIAALARADEALLHAKRSGRDRVELHAPREAAQ